MQLHVGRKQEPPAKFEATFRVELSAEEQALANQYCGDDFVLCPRPEQPDAPVTPQTLLLMRAGGMTLGMLRKGLPLQYPLALLLEVENSIAVGCRNLLAYLKAASTYRGVVTIDIKN